VSCGLLFISEDAVHEEDVGENAEEAADRNDADFDPAILTNEF
jgi:hypothetical protein